MLLRRLLSRAPAAIATPVLLLSCSGPYPQSALHPESDFAGAADAITRTVFWWALAVFVVVEGLLFFVVFRFRARPDAAPAPRQRGHTLLEVAWTAAPTAILVMVAVPTMRTIFDTYRVPAPALRVEAIGHQWWWEYRYPDLGISTANELHIPAGRGSVLLLTSADVIHSFWAPRLGGKRDMVAGRNNRIYFTPDRAGVYLGQCAEFCGRSHANMRFRVFVDDSAAFAAWVDQQRQPGIIADTAAAEAQEGLEEFLRIRTPGTHTCTICHTINGLSGGTLGPDLTHLAGRTTIAGGVLENTPENLERWLRDPAAIKPGSLMPTIPMSDQDRAQLITYLQTLK